MSAATDLVLTPKVNLAANNFIATETAQKLAIEKYGQFVEWEGRKIEILTPGDKRLLSPTTEAGYFNIIDPDAPSLSGMDVSKGVWRFSDEDILRPPSKRSAISFAPEDLAKLPKWEIRADLPAFWTDPKAPIFAPPESGTIIKEGPPILPGSDRANRDIPAIPATIVADPGSVRIGGENGVVLRDAKLTNSPEKPLRRLTEAEFRDGVFTTGFPAQDKVVGIADFDKDGKKDLLLQNAATGEMQIWYMNGQNGKIGEAPIIGAGIPIPAANWVIEGVGDFNNDQSPDLVWKELGGGGNIAIWFMNNNNYAGSVYVNQPFGNIPSNVRIEGVADLNNDGQTDLLWRDYASGANSAWIMTGTSVTNAFYVQPATTPSVDWKLAGVADFNGDGVKDIFWRNDVTAQNVYWQMNPGFQTAALQAFTTGGSPGSTIQDVGDMNSDGTPDLVWKSVDGSYWTWLLGGASTAVPVVINQLRSPGNNTSANTNFAGNFHSEFGYGMVNASAAIAYLKNQPIAREVPDYLGFNMQFDNIRQNEIVNLPEVWNQGYTGQGVTVAVIDSGVAILHPDLDNNIWTNSGEIPGDGIDNDANGFVDDYYGWDFIDNDNNPAPGNYAPDSHGTQVAGMIAAESTVNGSPVQGGAFNAKIMGLRVGNTTVNSQNQLVTGINTLAAAEAVRYAANKGANVINLSFAGSLSAGSSAQITFSNAVNYAVGKGAVVVISAANGTNNTIDTVFPAIFAGTPGVIAVGATNAGNIGVTSSSNSASQVASFSTGAGTTVRNYVTAPGNNVLTTTRTPTLLTPGNPSSPLANPTSYTYQYIDGTSFSAPLVAAIVATIKQAVPGATPAQITDALAQTADLSDIYL